MPTTNGPDPFPPVTYAQWRAGVESESGPDAVSRRLHSTTEDGIGIEPLYAAGGLGTDGGKALACIIATLQRDTARLRIRQRFPMDVPAAVLRAAIGGGVRSIELDGHGVPVSLERGISFFEGLTIPTTLTDDIELSFEDVEFGSWSMEWKAGPSSHGVDPIGQWLRGRGTAAEAKADLARQRPTQPFSDKCDRDMRATGESFHEAGATTGMTLGATMAVALAYLRAMIDGGQQHLRMLERAVETYPGPRHQMDRTEELIKQGINPTWIASLIEVRLPCSQHFFESVAMLRAARLLWARILEISSIPHSPLTLVASTGRRALTLHDPWNNALRNTAVAFAAAIGGADVLQLLPHDLRNGEPTAAALRLARTTGLILEEEAGLGRVVDPAQGSWFLESLTADIAAAAWEEMRRIDAEGGIIASIESGALGRRIAEQAAARHERVQDGRHPILGVTDHPVKDEVVHRSASDIADSDPSRPLPFRPDAMPVEAA